MAAGIGGGNIVTRRGVHIQQRGINNAPFKRFFSSEFRKYNGLPYDKTI